MFCDKKRNSVFHVGLGPVAWNLLTVGGYWRYWNLCFVERSTIKLRPKFVNKLQNTETCMKPYNLANS